MNQESTCGVKIFHISEKITLLFTKVYSNIFRKIHNLHEKSNSKKVILRIASSDSQSKTVQITLNFTGYLNGLAAVTLLVSDENTVKYSGEV